MSLPVPFTSLLLAGRRSPLNVLMRGCDSTPRLMAYWKLDEASSPWRDSVGQAHLETLAGAPTVEAGIIGNGVRLYDGPGLTRPTIIGKPTNPCYGFNQAGWTICGWFKFNCLTHVQGYPLILFTPVLGTIWLLVEADPDGVRSHTPGLDSFHFAVISDPFQARRLDYTDSLDLFNDRWNFYRAWLNPSDRRLYLQINNGTIQGPSDTDVEVFPPHDSGAAMQRVGSQDLYQTTGESIVFDETGYWTRMLSDAGADLLWNGGAGMTYPDILLYDELH